ncbi:MAG TPA: ABC transporter permease [Chloroflexota bacterium]|nr:ABC transporter permease [Chloroflexota bacterium]
MTRQIRADLRGVYVIWLRDVRRFTRDRMRIVAALAQPMLYLFIFGTGLSRSVGGAAQLGQGGTYVAFLFPGVIAMSVLFTSVFSAMSIVWDREFGFLKEVLVAPVSRWSVAVGKALGGASQAVMQGSILLILAPLAGVPLSWDLVLRMVPIMALLAFALTSLGIVIAARMKTMEGFQVVMNFLVMPMFFLSGALFPLQQAPAWLSVLTHIDPVAYGVDPLRRVVGATLSASAQAASGIEWLGHGLTIGEEVAVLALFGAAMLVPAVRAFQVQE